jgi:hypothetical protein
MNKIKIKTKKQKKPQMFSIMDTGKTTYNP